MLDRNHVELAKKYCTLFHEGQFRRGNNLPYHVHPLAVAGILENYGYNDPVTQCIALLHDTVEDAPANDSDKRLGEIHSIFGYEISNGVYILSKNKGKMRDGTKLSHDDYMKRLFWARNKIKRVKVADTIDNTRDLQTLKLESMDEKIKDAEEYYIPWGKEIAPLMVKELMENIDNYRIKMCLKDG